MRRAFTAICCPCLLCLLLIGCASSRLTIIHPLEQKLNPYRNVYFSALSKVTEDIDQEIAELEEKVIAGLKDTTLFDSARAGNCQEHCEKTLTVRGLITKIDKVSGSEHFLFGALAGKATVDIEVVFVDAPTGKILGVYSVAVKSSEETSSTINRAAKDIVKLIRENYR